MDSFMNLAKQGLQAYEKSHSSSPAQTPDTSGSSGQQPSHGRPEQYGGQDQGYEQQGQHGYGQQGGQGGQGGGYGGQGGNSGGQGGYNDQQQPNYQHPSGGYEQPQGNYGRQGGAEWNSTDNRGGSAQEYYNPQNLNPDEVGMNTASTYGHGEQDARMFSHAIQHVQNNPAAHQQPVDEQHVQNAHNVAYNQGGASGLSAGAMGSAAAMQALKMFTGGSAGGSGSQSDLISLAMSEASKLFDQSGGAASGGKQEVINGAATTVMKLLVQSKLSGAIGGGNSGGLGSLMGLASKLM